MALSSVTISLSGFRRKVRTPGQSILCKLHSRTDSQYPFRSVFLFFFRDAFCIRGRKCLSCIAVQKEIFLNPMVIIYPKKKFQKSFQTAKLSGFIFFFVRETPILTYVFFTFAQNLLQGRLPIPARETMETKQDA